MNEPAGFTFLTDKLKGAISYSRIAGYFDTSLFEIAGEAVEGVQGPVRIVCNSDIRAADVQTAGSNAEQIQRLSFFKNDPSLLSKRGSERLLRLWHLLNDKALDGSPPKLEIRVLPDDAFGLIHGKAGVISYPDGHRTSFLGSANETYAGWALNYELVWEDDSAEACDWVQAEFDKLWEHPLARPLADAIVKEIKRLATRTESDVALWKENPTPEPASIAIEAPVYRKEFGLWPHQKYFVELAWKAHNATGARFILADQVGLGKTAQLGMLAELMALTSEKPILVLLPKTLMEQWQTELWDLLEIPNARWVGSQWIDEVGIAHPPTGRKPLLDCPRKIGLISQGLVVHRSEMVDDLLEIDWECVIVDEAHRARRKKLPLPDEYGPSIGNVETETNNLYAFLWKLAGRTKSMLLSTGTPVQMHPIEAWDLLRLLSEGNDHVLGGIGSRWRTPSDTLPLILGQREAPREPSELWSWLKNPFPPQWEDDPQIRSLRKKWGMNDTDAVAPKSFEELPHTDRMLVQMLSERLFSTLNPFLRCIVRRTRDYLEKTIDPATHEPYLRRIEIELFGEENPVLLSGYLRSAYDEAEEFCHLLAMRVQSAGFFKTLLLRRIGSSMYAGLCTVNKILAGWSSVVEETEENEEDEEPTEEDAQIQEEIDRIPNQMRTLTDEEREVLARCKGFLEQSANKDPKLEIILKYLFENGWANEGCILFSQYFDTAQWIAQHLATQFPQHVVALYAGGNKSRIYKQGVTLTKNREEIKAMVQDGTITLLVGTDAASEGLNLQKLGTLINIDLPWNPTRLEQRKGRIQRIGQVRDTVKILNLRYQDSVEDKVHQALSTRLEQIKDMFGQIPDILEDVWIDYALGEQEAARARLDKIPKIHPFDERYGRIGSTSNWDECSQVVNREDRILNLRKPWK
ncbi:MAG TPA: helicase-related protein [Spirochaetales bacterium]|nr:helicase-related protein [Spirochaetales bacterium]